MAYIHLSTIIFSFMIIAILSGKPNTMVIEARNLLESNIPPLPKLESNIPLLPKLDFPHLAKHELLNVSELPKSEIPESTKPEFPKVYELSSREIPELSKFQKDELLEIPDQIPPHEIVIQPAPYAVIIPGPLLHNHP